MTNRERNKITEEAVFGNEIAIEAFYKNNLIYVRGYILQNSGNEQDVEDMYQEAIIIMYYK